MIHRILADGVTSVLTSEDQVNQPYPSARNPALFPQTRSDLFTNRANPRGR